MSLHSVHHLLVIIDIMLASRYAREFTEILDQAIFNLLQKLADLFVVANAEVDHLRLLLNSHDLALLLLNLTNVELVEDIFIPHM